MTGEQIEQYGGWISAICLLIAGALKVFFDYKKERTKTDGQLALKREEREQTSRSETLKQYTELQSEFNIVVHQLEEIKEQMAQIKAQMSLLYPLIKSAVKSSPELQEAIETAFKPFKQ